MEKSSSSRFVRRQILLAGSLSGDAGPVESRSRPEY